MVTISLHRVEHRAGIVGSWGRCIPVAEVIFGEKLERGIDALGGVGCNVDRIGPGASGGLVGGDA
jgi:hypothetical protein